STFLFTDIEGSTRLWQQDPARMSSALAWHDAIARTAVETHHGRVVKMTGDGVHAEFDDPLDAVEAALALQLRIDKAEATFGLALLVRCGLHLGVAEHRDNEVFGTTVNRAARLMAAAHGGQVLLSEAAVAVIADRLPEDVTLHDLGAVRLRDLAGPERVFQLVHPQLRNDFPPLRSLAAAPNNLPQQASSLVGRERELADIGKALIGTRLLTLVGVGGLGKTRLALQAAVDASDEFPDGVWFSDLAGIADARLVPQAVAMVLGVKQGAGEEAVEALLNHVQHRKLLIILDNCEHLLQACAELAKLLLQSSGSVKILATSRENLRIAGETTYLVPSLAVPGAAEVDEAATAARYDAVRLFVERAMAAQSGFELTDRLAPAVAEICRQLDGIPLAIELAAARVRSLPVNNIAERLMDRLRLLTGGDRTAAPRHKTLRASIDWSHELLSDHERSLLRRLSVFVGGWTVESAEDVCAGGSIERSMVLELLTTLVEKSLVQFDGNAGRYRMLETVREYAKERLEDSADDDPLHTRYLRFYVELVERAKAELRGPKQAAWLAKLDRERENLVSAHAASDRAEGGAELDLRLVEPLTRYCVVRGVPQLGYRIAVEALERGGSQKRDHAHCDAFFAGGQIAAHLGRYEEARSYLDHSLAMARELGETNRVVASLTLLGSVFLGQGDFAAAQARLEEAVAGARNENLQRQIASALSMLAEVHHTKRELDTAERLYREALEYFRTQGDADSIAVTLCNLAMLWIEHGEANRAQPATLEALDIVEAIGSKHTGHTVLEVVSGLAALRTSWEAAATFFGAAAREAEESGLEPSPPDTAFLESMIQRAHGAIGAPAFSVAEQAGRGLDYEQAITLARAWLVSGTQVSNAML
ncbi:MAG: ATP-binding protein, partial [Burkholderiales bacterium]